MSYKLHASYVVAHIDHALQLATLSTFYVSGPAAPKVVPLAQLAVYDIDEDRAVYFLSDKGRIYCLKRVWRDAKVGDTVEVICPLQALAEQA